MTAPSPDAPAHAPTVSPAGDPRSGAQPGPPTVSGTTLDEVVGLLDLDQAGPDLFQGGHTVMAGEVNHVFGGMVAAQAFVAAARTVAAERPVHSLHNYFLRPGDPSVPLEFHVERTRDGRSFSHRRVSAVQHGRTIAEMSCSFALPLDGVSHQAPAPEVPAPETVRPDTEILAGLPGVHPVAPAPDAFEMRTPGLADEVVHGRRSAPGESMPVWLRATGSVGDDPVLHAALLTYASDLHILRPVMGPHEYSTFAIDVRAASVDHAVWFHRPVPVDGWILMVNDSPWAGSGRGVARCRVYDDAGALVAEVAQEALFRLPD
ncbi:acyl-CoA thioesterase [Nocardioides insulae]|uniref:acyl-CoA thioesterase n=1 Tax=Nocardioides insulae TaxID=394734 RepID=UPI000A04F48E|nr:acyl-CoA thioesterase domain-containing protein [Nocardioides insulae]